MRRFGDMDYDGQEAEMKEHGYSGVDEDDNNFELDGDGYDDSYDDDYGDGDSYDDSYDDNYDE
jgi:hypothetical protein